ncbi:hypothetical protein ACFOY2_11845 [Nonomuraea purpurea]|uniref:CBM2 domain-containing protein n=1 Tax=Nonomuraea purpurea TaxID=1849276 RepID=A0ABV8G2K1_9ACTN
MPRRGDAPPPRAPQSEPFETTGAFALPVEPAAGPAGAFPPAPDPAGGQAGPFETTGAFVRPSEWGPPSDNGLDTPGERTAVFGQNQAPGAPGAERVLGPDAVPGGPGHPGPLGGPPPEGRGLFEPRNSGPSDRPGAPKDPFDGPGAAFFDEPGGNDTARFDGPGGNDTARFDGPGAAFFDEPGQNTARFDGPPDRRPGFDGAQDRGPGFDGPGFDGPQDRGPGFDGPGFDGPADRTARFDVPPPPVSAGPPEPGDIKVAGEPTAVQAPAWANADTSFLRADWSDSEPPPAFTGQEEPKGRRGRRKSRDDVLAAPAGAGKGKVALLSVAAVAVVLGGTVAGVKFMSSAGETGKCVNTTCAAVQAPSNQPGPAASDPPVEETEPEEEPTEEPSGKDSAQAETPTPTASYNVRTPRHTETPTPTPTKTKEKASAKPTKEREEAPPAEETPSQTPSEEPSTLDDADTGRAPTIDPIPTNTGSSDVGTGASASLNIRQTIRQSLGTYKADLELSNTSGQTLQGPTVSVSVEGKVMSVSGAGWTQDGDLLILDLPQSLAVGDSVTVSFTATGRGAKAGNCGMVSGECAIN